MQSNSAAQVQIYGQTYHVQGGQDAEHARRIARLVDEKMNLIATQVHTTDGFRIAVLAALHLADRCVGAEQRLKALEEEIATRTEELATLLDEVEEERHAASVYQAAS